MANEGQFPKSDGDVLYSSEVNKMHQGKYTYTANADFDTSGLIYLYNTIKAIYLLVNSPDISSLDFKIYSINSSLNGNILYSFTSPATHCYGLAYDGTNLISGDDGTNKIYIHKGISSTISNSFSSPSSTSPFDLTYDGTNLISCNDNKIYVHSGVTSTITNSFAAADSDTYGLTYDGTNLISSDQITDKIYIYSGVTSTISNSFNAPGSYCDGIAYDGTNLISSDISTDKIYVHSGVTSTISSSFNSPAEQPTALTYDNPNLISNSTSTYKFYVHGSKTEIQSISPGYNSVDIDTTTATTNNKFVIVKTTSGINNLQLIASE